MLTLRYLQVGNSLYWPPWCPDIVGLCEYQAWLAGCFLASYPPFFFFEFYSFAVHRRLLLTCFSPRIAMAPAVGSLIAVFLMPETLASAILRKKAAKLTKKHANTGKRFVAPSDIKRESAWASYVSTPRYALGVVAMELTWHRKQPCHDRGACSLVRWWYPSHVHILVLCTLCSTCEPLDPWCRGPTTDL